MRIDDIHIGARCRKELGDIAGLARSIDEIGLLHPPVVTPDGELIAGTRRLAALRMLGYAEIPVTVVSLQEIVKGEHAENILRKDFTPSEAVSIARALEPLERQVARERQGERTDQHPVKFSGSSGNALDKVAASVGMSRPTLAKAQAVVEAAETEPERFASLLAQMDETGKVNRAYSDLKRQRMAEIPKPAPPQGRYRCIVIDPPWPVIKIEREVRPNQDETLDYPTMSMEEIAALPINDLAVLDGCHVYLWVTQKYLPDGLRLFASWGTTYQCVLTWVKPTGMTPYTWMYNTEHVLFGHIGSLRVLRMGMKLSFDAPVIRHSQKPDVFYERVLEASPGPRLEMFARTKREGFVAWGLECQ